MKKKWGYFSQRQESLRRRDLCIPIGTLLNYLAQKVSSRKLSQGRRIGQSSLVPHLKSFQRHRNGLSVYCLALVCPSKTKKNKNKLLTQSAENLIYMWKWTQKNGEIFSQRREGPRRLDIFTLVGTLLNYWAQKVSPRKLSQGQRLGQYLVRC